MKTVADLAAPLLQLLGDWSLRWAVLVALLAVVLAVLRPRRTGVRYLLCLTVLLAGLGLPLLPRWGGFRLSHPTPPAEVALQPKPAPVFTPPSVEPSDPVADDSAPPPAIQEREAVVATTEPLDYRDLACLLLAGGWVLGVAFLLLRRLAGACYLHRLRRTASPANTATADVFAAARQELNLRRAVTLAAHADVRSPIAFGVWRPIVVVPEDFGERAIPVRRATLLHELAHLRRRDDLLNLLLELVRVAFFFHPLVRWLLARLERERELLCDETALAHGVDRRDYVQMLLDFARQPCRLGWPTAFVPLRFGAGRTVKARITHLLEEDMDRPMKPLSARHAYLFGALVLACALGAGSFRVLALEPAAVPNDPQEKKDAAKADDKPAPLPTVNREALRYGGKSFEQWRAELLTELKPDIRIDGIKALTAFGMNGYGPEATAAVLETVKGYDSSTDLHDDRKVFDAGLDAVKRIGAPAVPALRDGLSGDNKNIRQFAVLGLKRIGPAAKDAVPALFKSATDKNVIMRRDSLRAITAINPEADGALAVFRKALKDEDQNVSVTAIEGLERLGPKAREAVPALVEVLHDKNKFLHRPILVALHAIKPDLKEIIEPVMECFERGDQRSHEMAGSLLAEYAKVGKGDVAVAPLAAYLRKRDATYPWDAIALLEVIGPAAKGAISALQEFVENTKEPNMLNAAKEALRKIREK